MRSSLGCPRGSLPVGPPGVQKAPYRARVPCPAVFASVNRPEGLTAKLPGSTSLTRNGVRARVLTTGTTVAGVVVDVDQVLANLLQYHTAEGRVKSKLHVRAVESAQLLKNVVADAVNSKSPGLRSLQTTIVSSGAVGALVHIARQGEPIGYEALQIMCYRNTVACQQIVSDGVVDRIAIDLPASTTTLQCSMCHLLTALVAFNEGTHEAVAAAGLIPQLVSMCRQSCRLKPLEDDTSEMLTLLENRAAAVLRNLAHNTKQHNNLVQAGAVDALADIMRQTQRDTKSRINAALAVAILVGHEENNPRLQLDEELVETLLEVLEAASQGVLYLGVFWTVWKICQGLANLTVNDNNKDLIAARGGVELLAEVLFGKHHNNEATHRYALSAIWNLAFNDTSRRIIVETPGLVDAIRNILATTESPKTKEVAKGALWTLGLEQDIKSLTDNTGHHIHDELSGALGAGGHIMLSYEWGQQQSVMLIKSELQKAGYQTWMDVDKMSGSTLEAMAKAVEGSAVVLVCVSKKYKESQACRTEAEYAFQQRKKIVPLLMERDYKPSGWLGALMGTRLYFDMSDVKRIPSKSTSLFKELGGSGKLVAPGGVAGGHEPKRSEDQNMKMRSDSPEGWTNAEVDEWLKKIKCSEFAAAFREKDMDGMALSGLLRMSSDCRLTHEVLTSEFGIYSLGQRLRLVEELHRLFA